MAKTTENANKYIAENKHKVDPRYRNKYHAAAPIGWMNDPNGFCYAFGKYRLFYQYHPYSAVWGSMHWGYKTSDDLVSWHDEPVALAPDMPYDSFGCFSGTALADGDRLYIMYTSVCDEKQTQALAVTDDGITFKKLGEIIPSEKLPADNKITDFRDPKLIKKDGTYYSLIGATAKCGAGRVLMYKSEDMRDWELVGVTVQDERSIAYECPDYFELDGKHVFIVSPQNIATDGVRYQNQHSNIYMIGDLDFSTGKLAAEYEDDLDSGFDFYAAQTTVAPDGRTLLIAWMSMWDRTNVTAPHGWAGCMTFPRELSIKNGRLYQNPARELERYRGDHYSLDAETVENCVKPLPKLGDTQDIAVTFDIGTAQKVGFKLRCGDGCETLVYYDRNKKTVVFDRTNMGTELAHGANESDAYVRYAHVDIEDNKITMRLLLDVSSCEAFVENGLRVMTGNIYSAAACCDNYLFAEGGTAKIEKLDAYSLDI